jgi:hypothetical protein
LVLIETVFPIVKNGDYTLGVQMCGLLPILALDGSKSFPSDSFVE